MYACNRLKQGWDPSEGLPIAATQALLIRDPLLCMPISIDPLGERRPVVRSASSDRTMQSHIEPSPSRGPAGPGLYGLPYDFHWQMSSDRKGFQGYPLTQDTTSGRRDTATQSNRGSSVFQASPGEHIVLLLDLARLVEGRGQSLQPRPWCA